MQTKVIGGGVGTPGLGQELAVDPVFAALRSSIRPLEYTAGGLILGHYSAAVTTGTTVSIGAGGIYSYLRWAPTSGVGFLALMRVSALAIISSTITTGVPVDLALQIGRGSTAAGSGGNAVTIGGNNQKNRLSMGGSLVTDMRIATTAALTAPTGNTNDANPVGFDVTPLSGQTATTTAPGPKIDLYKWDSHGKHPIILQNGETAFLNAVTAGPTTGGIKWYFDWEWAEVPAF
jgi:hypothetical protein